MEINSLRESLKKSEKEYIWEDVPLAHIESEREYIWKDAPLERHNYGRIVERKKIRLWQIPPTTGAFLKWLIQLSKPKYVLEIGTGIGYSTLWMAEPLSHFDGTINTIEIFSPKIELARENFAKSKLKNIELLQGDAMIITQNYPKPVNLLFLDADKENYLCYLKNLEHNFTDGAIIVADNAVDCDYMMDDFLDYVENSKNYQSVILNLDKGLLLANYYHE